MNSTHAPQQTSPLDRLPNELLVKILLVLPPTTVALYMDPPRFENALFAISLVSKRFHALNSDLLWRRTAIAAPSTTFGFLFVVALLARWPAVAQGGPELDLDCAETVGARRLQDWAVVLPGVQRLVLHMSDDVQLVDIARFHNLRHLSVVDCSVVFAPTVVFPRLESTRLTHSGVDASAPDQAFPVLCHLALDYLYFNGETRGEPVFSNGFLGRLEGLEVCVEYWHDDRRDDVRLFPLDAPPASLPVLWRVSVSIDDPLHEHDVCLSTASIPYGRHLLLEASHSQRNDPVSAHWERKYVELRRLVALHAHSRLRLVLVSGAPWRQPGATAPELAALEALEGDCERRGVALRPCQPPRVEDGALPEFVAFLREQAARARS
ncbi:hypothetical protein JCM9279_001938 [Rhodotorula babjevae]